MLRVAHEVGALLGEDLIGRYRAEQNLVRGTCFTCEQPVDVGTDDASLIVVDPVPHGRQVRFARLTHTACCPSMIRSTSVDQLTARRALITGEDSRDDRWTSHGLVTIWPAREESPFPAVLFNLGTALAEVADDGTSDPAAAWLLARGWHAIEDMDTSPPPLPDGWAIAYDTADGILALAQPDGNLLVDVEMRLTADFAQILAAISQAAIFVAPLPLHQWANELDVSAMLHAIDERKVVGGTCPLRIF